MQIEHKYNMGSHTVASVYYSTYCKSIELTLTERSGNEANIVSVSLNGERMKQFVKEMIKIQEEIENQEVDSE